MKPGFKSSELYVVGGTILATVLNKRLGLDLTPADVVSICTLAGGYLAQRFATKRQAPQ